MTKKTVVHPGSASIEGTVARVRLFPGGPVPRECSKLVAARLTAPVSGLVAVHLSSGARFRTVSSPAPGLDVLGNAIDTVPRIVSVQTDIEFEFEEGFEPHAPALQLEFE